MGGQGIDQSLYRGQVTFPELGSLDLYGAKVRARSSVGRASDF